MASRVRLSDVARAAGVSPTTASFVLAGREDMRISEAAKERVRAAAAELGYRPNLTARSLRTQVTRTIGFVSDTIATDPFAGETVRGAINAAIERGHLLLIAETEGDDELERRLIDDMLDRQVDGLIYASMFTREVSVPEAAGGHRLVLLNAFAPDTGVAAVIPDELGAGSAAAEVLLEAGHEDGIHLVGALPADLFAARERSAGIKATLGAAGTGLASIIKCSWAPQPAHDAVAAFLAGGGRPTALICVNDRVAFGALQATGRRAACARRLSIVSFDDSDLARWSRPAFTSLALPHEDMGRTAVELLLEPPELPSVRHVPMPLRRRDPVGPPAHEHNSVVRVGVAMASGPSPPTLTGIGSLRLPTNSPSGPRSSQARNCGPHRSQRAVPRSSGRHGHPRGRRLRRARRGPAARRPRAGACRSRPRRRRDRGGPRCARGPAR